MRRAVLARLAQQVADASVGEDREAFEAERWPRPITTKTLEAVAIAGAHGHPGVDVEAVDLGAPRALAVAAVPVVVGIERGAGAAAQAHERPAEERELHARFERRERRGLIGALFGGAIVEETATTASRV